MPIFIWIFLIPFWIYGALLEEKIQEDLSFSNIPFEVSQDSDSLDVAIIGAGHAGKGLYLALQKQGIQKIAIFESAIKGEESIWLSTARMKTLRSGKNSVGPALTIPHLTFRAWYEAQGNSWNEVVKIPTHLWGHYLEWFEEVLHLPVFYNWHLQEIQPDENKNLELIFDQGRIVRTKKVILATGRSSFGGVTVPSFVQQLPKKFWYHTSEKIDSLIFDKKKICVIGAASSAFDLAATAIESGAFEVNMLMRRKEVKTQNYLFRNFKTWLAYYYLPDEEKITLIHNASQHGFCPPVEAVERVADYPQFHLHPQTTVEHFSYTEDQVTIHTNLGTFETDLVFVATGFKCDPFLVPQISSFVDEILLWKDKIKEIPSYLELFPYLGKAFELLEKKPGTLPFLKNIHCFNFGSYLSHGNTGIDIDQFHIGAERIAEAIAIDLMLDQYIPKVRE